MKLFLRKSFLTAAFIIFSSPAVFASEQLQQAKEISQEKVETARNLIQMLLEYCLKYSLQALGGVIILIIGWLLGRYLAGLTLKFLEKKPIDVTIAKFLASGVKMMVIAFALIVALGKFGIEIAPLIAGISVVGVGIGFALQGTLSNYAAGVALIFTKPFKVGDIIEVVNEVGEVVDVKLGRTDLKTVDGTMIFIPNKHIVGEVIHNYSDLKRLDIAVGVGYKSDVQKAIAIVIDAIKNHPQAILDRQPKVGISEFADSSIKVLARFWCKQDYYWDVMFSVNKKIFDEFKKNGIEIPFPQREVHIHQQK